MVDRDEVLRKLVDIQYTRNDQALARGTLPRARRDARGLPGLRRDPPTARVFFGDEIEQVQHFDPLTGEVYARARARRHLAGDPLRHRPANDRARRSRRSATSSRQRCKELEREGKLLESHRLRQRTQFDMEMLRELGFCNGIENYSRILDGRAPGARPYCLLDFFPDDFVCFIDESHQTVPQIGGMYEGDRSRKQTLVDYGFRLPSAIDNRPQTFDEFLAQHAADRLRLGHARRVRARPLQRGSSSRSSARPASSTRRSRSARRKNQIDDLMNEIRGPRRGATSARWSRR